VARYARLRAELDAPDAVRADVLRRHGASEQLLVALEAAWRERFEVEPAVQMEFQQLLRSARAARPRGGG
jgi:hypothetical protein